ncbi:LysM peptidoglycan-binding domain-containing protein [Sphingomonas sp. ID1715]|uniref:DNA/RNA non-specific endonuclease n=1 Tax=Sphingomonas sp. ID1715 TaxID=1656898 RepID=UPI001488CB48|nr:DNA/RNA non-specific endonuclease [Sphingomonas sp. ID1715]NNM77231.1 LysM peptidoglycan-binding domain-containing protein [Sphingomonas sp. ID1715]
MKGESLSSIGQRYKITAQQLQKSNRIVDADHILAGQQLTIPAKSKEHQGWVTFADNGYYFSLDELGRTRRVDGELRREPSTRSARMQGNAGQPDRREDDDGGHLIAVRFGGPKATYNHFAQNANFNRGAYRALEDTWSAEQRRGKDVRVRIRVQYQADSRRPHRLLVAWTSSGRPEKRVFGNAPGGKRD